VTIADPVAAAATSVGQLPALLIMVPLLAAPVCVLLRRELLVWVIALLASLTSAVVAWQVLAHVGEHGPIRYAIGGWMAPTGIEYYIDTLNATMLLLVSSISSIVLVYARQSISLSIGQDRHYLFYAAWLLCLTGLLGIAITGDAFNVFVFLEISSLATYMLIAFGDDRRALVASFRYLVLGSVGASFILIGIGFLYAATGTLNMVDLAVRIPDAESSRAVLVAFSFLTIGLMIKAAIFPLHAWLGDAYCGFTIMSLVAVFQTDLRRMLAFSSVAQIGFIVAGVALATEAGLSAGIVHIINHAVVKATLFMAVGCILYRVGHVHKPSLDELYRRMPFTCTAFALAGLGLIGVPLSAGFVSKFQLIDALFERDLWPIVVLVLISSLLSFAYIGRTVEIMLFRKGRAATSASSSGVEHGHLEGINEAPLGLLIPLYVMLRPCWSCRSSCFTASVIAICAKVSSSALVCCCS